MRENTGAIYRLFPAFVAAGMAISAYCVCDYITSKLGTSPGIQKTEKRKTVDEDLAVKIQDSLYNLNEIRRSENE